MKDVKHRKYILWVISPQIFQYFVFRHVFLISVLLVIKKAKLYLYRRRILLNGPLHEQTSFAMDNDKNNTLGPVNLMHLIFPVKIQ